MRDSVRIDGLFVASEVTIQDWFTITFGEGSFEQLEASSRPWFNVEIIDARLLSIEETGALQCYAGGGDAIIAFKPKTAIGSRRELFLIRDDTEGAKWDVEHGSSPRPHAVLRILQTG